MVIDHPIFLESIKFIRSRLVANDLNYLEKKVLDVHKIHFILAKTENKNLLISDIKKLLKDCNKVENKKLHDFNYLWKKYAVADRFDTKETIFIKRILQYVLPNTIRTKFCNRKNLWL